MYFGQVKRDVTNKLYEIHLKKKVVVFRIRWSIWLWRIGIPTSGDVSMSPPTGAEVIFLVDTPRKHLQIE